MATIYSTRRFSSSVLFLTLLLFLLLSSNKAVAIGGGTCVTTFCEVSSCCPTPPPGYICQPSSNPGLQCEPCGSCGGGSAGSDSPTTMPSTMPSTNPSASPTLRSPTASPTASPTTRSPSTSPTKAKQYKNATGTIVYNTAPIDRENSTCAPPGLPSCCQERYEVKEILELNDDGYRRNTVWLQLTSSESGCNLTACPVLTTTDIRGLGSNEKAFLPDGRYAMKHSYESNELTFLGDANCMQAYVVTAGEMLGASKESDCLSGDGIVRTSTSTTTKVADLKIGTQVEVAGGAFEPVIYLSHHWDRNGKRKDDDAEAMYLQIRAGDKVLHLTRRHQIPVVQDGNKEPQTVPARLVRVGDYVFGSNEEMLRVDEIGFVHLIGAYSPLTPSGQIVVNGILVSCYVEAPVPTWVAQIGAVALNSFYKVLPLPAYKFLAKTIDYVNGQAHEIVHHGRFNMVGAPHLFKQLTGLISSGAV